MLFIQFQIFYFQKRIFEKKDGNYVDQEAVEEFILKLQDIGLTLQSYEEAYNTEDNER